MSLFHSHPHEHTPLGQLLLVGIPGPELTPDVAAVIEKVQPGGFILFTRNIQSPAQLRKLIDDLRSASKIEPIITIDQEGGRVSRLKEIGNEPPNANQLRDCGKPELITTHGRLTADILRIFGFNLDLCPVLDIAFDDEADNSLRGRCYGSSAAAVMENAALFNDAMRAGGILSCGKHFPGYSRAPLDAHHELPTIPLSREDMDPNELAVFRRFCAIGSPSGTDEVDSMMIGHAFYPELDASGTPTSLSKVIITDLLRGEFEYRGLVMTDDLDMGAVLNPYGLDDSGLEKVIHMAISAGNDLAMICHRLTMVERAWEFLKGVPTADLDRALESVAHFKKKLAPAHAWDKTEFRRRDAAIYDLRVATLGAEAATIRSPDGGKRSPVEVY